MYGKFSYNLGNNMHYVTFFESIGSHFKLKSNHKLTKHNEVYIFPLVLIPKQSHSIIYTMIVMFHSQVYESQYYIRKSFGTHKNCGLNFKFNIKDSNQIEKRF